MLLDIVPFAANPVKVGALAGDGADRVQLPRVLPCVKIKAVIKFYCRTSANPMPILQSGNIHGQSVARSLGNEYVGVLVKSLGKVPQELRPHTHK